MKYKPGDVVVCVKGDTDNRPESPAWELGKMITVNHAADSYSKPGYQVLWFDGVEEGIYSDWVRHIDPLITAITYIKEELNL